TGVGATISSPQPVVAERPMYMDQLAGAFSQIPVPLHGAHDARAVPPAGTWYFAEGTTQPDFQMYLTVLNPSDSATTATFRYSVEGSTTPVVKTRVLAPRSRTTVDVVSNEEGALGAQVSGLSVIVSAPTPI